MTPNQRLAMSLQVLLIILLLAAPVQCEAFITSRTLQAHRPSTNIARRCSSTQQFQSQSPSPFDEVQNSVNPASSSPIIAIPPPPPPELKRVPLPAMLAGGLFLFATSVPKPQKTFANELLKLSEAALNADPTVVMELGTGVEAGGVYASSHASAGNGNNGGDDQLQLVLQFQINGGNAWAQGVAYGVQYKGDGNERGGVKLLTLEVANMDAVLNGQSFQIPLK